MTRPVADVAVVIPYYDQQGQLDLVLAALDDQSVPPAEVVIADDGSPRAPLLTAHPYPLRRVRHDDQGFRASAARALGADATTAPILAFLDADTIPSPGYLEALVAHVNDGPCGTLTVGRRLHADLTGWTPDRFRAWQTGGPGPTLLDDPYWLREGYDQTNNLLAADERSYRFVISAVLAMPRELYKAAGGFDPDFVGYGGEDWDLAHRVWLAGGDLRHIPDAVAWHDGPDLAGRNDPRQIRRVKDSETLHLAHVLTDPFARGAGLLWRYPHTIAVVHGRPSPGTIAATASSLLHGSDAALWFPDIDTLPPELTDPRLHAGTPPPDVLQRARIQADIPGPVLIDGGLGALGAQQDDITVPGLGRIRLRRTRDLARSEREAVRDPGQEALREEQQQAQREEDPGEVGKHAARHAQRVTALQDEATLEARWAGWA